MTGAVVDLRALSLACYGLKKVAQSEGYDLLPKGHKIEPPRRLNVSRTGPPWGKSATPHYPVNSSGPASAGRNRDVLWSHGFVAAEGAADGALLLR